MKLLPNNKRLKQLIKEFGEDWDIIEKRKVQCFNDIGIFIISKCGKHKRWVKEGDLK